MQILLNFKTSCCNKTVKWISFYFNFEKNYCVLKSKSSCFLLNKSININKNETE